MSRISNTPRARKQLGNAGAVSLPYSSHFFTRVTQTGVFYIVSHYRDRMIQLMAAKGFKLPEKALKYGTNFSGYYFKMYPYEFKLIQSLIDKISEK